MYVCNFIIIIFTIFSFRFVLECQANTAELWLIINDVLYVCVLVNIIYEACSSYKVIVSL